MKLVLGTWLLDGLLVRMEEGNKLNKRDELGFVVGPPIIFIVGNMVGPAGWAGVGSSINGPLGPPVGASAWALIS